MVAPIEKYINLCYVENAIWRRLDFIRNLKKSSV